MQISKTLESVPCELSKIIVCCYINHTRKLQIVRIKNIPNCNFERLIFPGERLLFEAVAEAYLEINLEVVGGTIIASEEIRCDRLRVF